MGQPFQLPTSLPLHDAPAGKSSTRLHARLFVYVTAQSPYTSFTYTYYLYESYDYLYVLLIQPTYLYIYTFIVEAARLCLLLNPPISTLLPPIHLHLPFTFTVYLPYPIYLYDLWGETRGTLFRLSCPFYICILILIRSMYTNCCGPPG